MEKKDKKINEVLIGRIGVNCLYCGCLLSEHDIKVRDSLYCLSCVNDFAHEIDAKEEEI